MDLNNIYAPIKKELEEVEGKLRESFPATNNFLKKINEHLFWGKEQGKRIRPALVLFSAKVDSPTASLGAAIELAVAVELIHTASLIHDDIIDNASWRHHRLTLHQRYGNQVAILAGDILYAQAFSLLSAIGESAIVKAMSNAVRKVCLGEIEEIRFRGSTKEKEYFEIVSNKTAALMSACCETAALLNGGDKSGTFALRDYGLNFGLAYQIIDDYLDLFGEKEKTGKSLSLDLKEGILTLPLIRLQEVLKEKNNKKENNISVTALRKNEVKRLLLKYNILGYIRGKTEVFLSRAKEKLTFFHTSVYKDGLLKLTEYVCSRET